MRLPDPPLEHDQVRKPAKRAGRDPVILWVRFPLWSPYMIPWSNGEDAWPTSRKVQVRFLPGSLATIGSVSVVVAHVRGMDGERVRSPDGPLKRWACMPLGATDPCKIGVVGSTPIRSTDLRKVAGYGWPGRPAKACHHEVMRVRIPCLPPTARW